MKRKKQFDIIINSDKCNISFLKQSTKEKQDGYSYVDINLNYTDFKRVVYILNNEKDKKKRWLLYWANYFHPKHRKSLCQDVARRIQIVTGLHVSGEDITYKGKWFSKLFNNDDILFRLTKQIQKNELSKTLVDGDSIVFLCEDSDSGITFGIRFVYLSSIIEN